MEHKTSIVRRHSISLKQWKNEKLIWIVIGILLCGGAAFLFYRSWIAWPILLGGLPFFLLFVSKKQKKKELHKLERQFKSAIQMVAGSLVAGYSMENAWRMAYQDMVKLYGAGGQFCIAMREMNQKMSMNQPLDQCLFEYAKTCGVEDIWNFAEIFRYAKRSGGNLTEIIRQTVQRMEEKQDVLEEIQNAVTAQKMEQRLMCLLLPGILLFVTLTSPEYSMALYHNFMGILVMTICLMGYIGAFLWSEKITDIPV